MSLLLRLLEESSRTAGRDDVRLIRRDTRVGAGIRNFLAGIASQSGGSVTCGRRRNALDRANSGRFESPFPSRRALLLPVLDAGLVAPIPSRHPLFRRVPRHSGLPQCRGQRRPATRETAGLCTKVPTPDTHFSRTCTHGRDDSSCRGCRISAAGAWKPLCTKSQARTTCVAGFVPMQPARPVFRISIRRTE